MKKLIGIILPIVITLLLIVMLVYNYIEGNLDPKVDPEIEVIDLDRKFAKPMRMYIKVSSAGIRTGASKDAEIKYLEKEGDPILAIGTKGDFIAIRGQTGHYFVHESKVAANIDELIESRAERGIISEGMTKDQVRKAWGEPDTEYNRGSYSSWKYDRYNLIVTITFEDGIYTDKSEFKHNYDD